MKNSAVIRAAGMYEDIRTGPHHVFRIQLTLSQPGGQIMPTTVLWALSGSEPVAQFRDGAPVLDNTENLLL